MNLLNCNLKGERETLLGFGILRRVCKHILDVENGLCVSPEGRHWSRGLLCAHQDVQDRFHAKQNHHSENVCCGDKHPVLLVVILSSVRGTS